MNTYLSTFGRALGLISLSAILLVAPACTKGKSEGSPAASASAQVSGAKIAFDTTVHDFGTVTEGDTVEHVFVVRNEGTSPLILDRVRSSCGCTAAVLKSKEVPPGGTTEVKVTFNTAGRMGPNRKTITIQNNDPSNKNAKIEIKANIERLLAFQPAMVRLNVEHGKSETVEAWLNGKLAADAKLAVKEVTGDDALKVEVTEKKEGDETKRGIKISLDGKKVGRTSGTIVVTTGVEKVPELTLRFNANVLGNVQVRPRALYFDTRSPAGRERVLNVSSSKEGFKVTDAKVLEGPYKATVTRPETGTGFEVRVSLTAPEPTKPAADDGKEDPALNGKLVIVSNDPLEPKIEIPLNVRSMPGMNRPRPAMPVRRMPMAPIGAGSAK